MIPYEDLVIALQTWRARQGLPVAQMSGQLTPPPIASAPPAPPQAFLGNVSTPPPLAPAGETHEESLDVDGALIEETHYENEGDDFAMAFGSAGSEEAPERPTEANIEEGTEVASPGGRRGRGEDW